MSVMTISDMDEHENEQYSTDFGGFLLFVLSKMGVSLMKRQCI